MIEFRLPSFSNLFDRNKHVRGGDYSSGGVINTAGKSEEKKSSHLYANEKKDALKFGKELFTLLAGDKLNEKLIDGLESPLFPRSFAREAETKSGRSVVRLTERGKAFAKKFYEKNISPNLAEVQVSPFGNKFTGKQTLLALKEMYTYSVSISKENPHKSLVSNDKLKAVNDYQNEIFRLMVGSWRAQLLRDIQKSSQTTESRDGFTPFLSPDDKEQNALSKLVRELKRIRKPLRIMKNISAAFLGFVAARAGVTNLMTSEIEALAASDRVQELIMEVDIDGALEVVPAWMQNQQTSAAVQITETDEPTSTNTQTATTEASATAQATDEPTATETNVPPTKTDLPSATPTNPAELPTATQNTEEEALFVANTFSTNTPQPSPTEVILTATDEPAVTETNVPVTEADLPTTFPINTEAPSPTALPTDAPSETLTEDAFMEELANTQEIDNLLEWVYGGEFLDKVIESRMVRLGMLEIDESKIPEGYKVVREYPYNAPHGIVYEDIVVPDDLEERFYYIYSPTHRAINYGLYDGTRTVEEVVYARRINILIANSDSRAEYGAYSDDTNFLGRVDAPIILSIDFDAGTFNLISEARDIRDPQVARYTGVGDPEISVSSWGYKDSNNNLRMLDRQFTLSVFESSTSLLLDGMTEVNFDAVAEMIDALYPGGLPVEVSEAIHDGDFLNVEPGLVMMNGEMAVNYSRSRYASAGGDLDRQDRQRQIAMLLFQTVGEEVEASFRGARLAAIDKNIPEAIRLGAEGAGRLNEFFDVVDEWLVNFENRVNDIDGIEATGGRLFPGNGMVRNTGLNPRALLLQARESVTALTDPRNSAALIRLLQSEESMALIRNLTSGDSIQTLQITSQDVDTYYRNATTSSGYVNYWAPAREKVGEMVYGDDLSQNEHVEYVNTYSSDTDWLISEDGPFGQIDLPYVQQLAIIRYVRLFGELQPGDITDRLNQFDAALILARLTSADTGSQGMASLQYQITSGGDRGLAEAWFDYYAELMNAPEEDSAVIAAIFKKALYDPASLTEADITIIFSDFSEN